MNDTSLSNAPPKFVTKDLRPLSHADATKRRQVLSQKLSDLEWLRRHFPAHFKRHRLEHEALGACRELAPSKQESTTYEPSLVCKLLILGCRLLIPDRLLEAEFEGTAWKSDVVGMMRKLSDPFRTVEDQSNSSTSEIEIRVKSESPSSLVHSIRTTGGSPRIVPLSDSGKSKKAKQAKLERLRIAAALSTSDDGWLIKQAWRLSQCASLWSNHVHRYESDKSRRRPANLCGLRLCSVCNGYRRSRWEKRVTPVVERVIREGRILKMLTLTQRARPGEGPQGGLDRLNSAFNRLRRRVAWKDHVRSYFAARETTGGSKGEAFHTHMHILLDADYWDHAEISELWSQVTGGESSVVHICALDSIGEAIKYPLKSVDIPDHMLVQFALETRGRRFVSAGGEWKTMLSDQSLDDDTDSTEFEVLTDEELFGRVRGGRDPYMAAALFAVLKQEQYTPLQIYDVFYELDCPLPTSASIHKAREPALRVVRKLLKSEVT